MPGQLFDSGVQRGHIFHAVLGKLLDLGLQRGHRGVLLQLLDFGLQRGHIFFHAVLLALNVLGLSTDDGRQVLNRAAAEEKFGAFGYTAVLGIEQLSDGVSACITLQLATDNSACITLQLATDNGTCVLFRLKFG